MTVTVCTARMNISLAQGLLNRSVVVMVVVIMMIVVLLSLLVSFSFCITSYHLELVLPKAISFPIRIP